MSDNLTTYLQWLEAFQNKQLAKQNLTGPATFLLKHGKSFQASPKTFPKRKGEIKMCFANATHMVFENPKRFTYVEGYLEHIIPIEHAWVYDNKNKIIIDPTLRSPEHAGEYFGVPFKTEYLRIALLRKKTYGLFCFDNVMELLRENSSNIVQDLA